MRCNLPPVVCESVDVGTEAWTMKPTICICCGQPMTASLPDNPNLCRACGDLAGAQEIYEVVQLAANEFCPARHVCEDKRPNQTREYYEK